MPTITIAGKALAVDTLTPLKRGQELAALEAARQNGLDDVVIRIGEDAFVASGRGLKLGGVKPNAAVTVDGRVGNVVGTDRQLNSFKEGILAWPGLVVGGGITAWGLIGFVQGVLAGANMAGLG